MVAKQSSIMRIDIALASLPHWTSAIHTYLNSQMDDVRRLHARKESTWQTEGREAFQPISSNGNQDKDQRCRFRAQDLRRGFLARGKSLCHVSCSWCDIVKGQVGN